MHAHLETRRRQVHTKPIVYQLGDVLPAVLPVLEGYREVRHGFVFGILSPWPPLLARSSLRTTVVLTPTPSLFFLSLKTSRVRRNWHMTSSMNRLTRRRRRDCFWLRFAAAGRNKWAVKSRYWSRRHIVRKCGRKPVVNRRHGDPKTLRCVIDHPMILRPLGMGNVRGGTMAWIQNSTVRETDWRQ